MSITYGGTIEKVRRLLTPNTGFSLALGANYTAASGTITLDHTNPAFQGVQPGVLISVDLNVLLVTAVPNQSTGVTPVVGGWLGSTDANATSGEIADVSPRFTRWDISNAILEEISALDAPTTGIGQILTVMATYIPVFQGYDLGTTFDTNKSKVLEVSFKIAPPYRTYPLIRRGDYRVIRHADTSVFPNGSGLVIYKAAWPGFPITVQYLAPFTPPTNLTDDLLSVSGIPVNMQDIVYMGAMLRLAPDREIDRNSTGRQPDPRKAPEVPPGAVMAATNALQARYIRRLNEESSRIKRAYPQAEWA